MATVMVTLTRKRRGPRPRHAEQDMPVYEADEQAKPEPVRYDPDPDYGLWDLQRDWFRGVECDETLITMGDNVHTKLGRV